MGHCDRVLAFTMFSKAGMQRDIRVLQSVLKALLLQM